MATKIMIPTPLRPFTDKKDAVEAEGKTVGELLADLTTRHAGLKAHLYNDQGKLRSFVNVYVNDEDIRYLQKEQTPVNAGDTVSIIPSVAGGAPSTTDDRRVRLEPDVAANRELPSLTNDEDIRYLQKEQTPVNAGDTVSIIPSVAGGVSERGVSGAFSGGVVAEKAPDTRVPDTLPQLTNDEIKRYSRHLIMPEVGMDGQRKLKAASVLCIGAGGLGSPVAMYLAAAGVGTLGIVDFDVVDFSNLQRQILHGTRDVGRTKLASAKDRLTDINPEITVNTHDMAISSENALELFAPYDIIVDGTDNFPTRYLVNDACVLLNKPNVYGSIFRFEGQASVFATKEGPCYRCLYPEPPPPGLVPSCAEGGVLGVLPGVVGCIQATEAIKLIIGAGEPLIGRFLIFDALRMKFRELKLRKDPDCPVCSAHPTVTHLIDYEQFCGIHPVVEPVVSNATDISAVELKRRLDRGDRLTILDVREPNEYQINRIAGSVLIPLGDVPKRYHELDPNEEVITQCKVGGRSAKAADFLRSVGFKKVLNLTGGIVDWIDKVDPSQPKY